MTSPFDRESSLLRGPLLREAGRLPLTLNVRWCDVRPRVIDKGRAGRGYRAISRNGRVLIASDVPLAELPGRVTRVRIQTWHKVILPGDPPQPYGVLLCVRGQDVAEGVSYDAGLEQRTEDGYDLALDVAGRQALVFRKRGNVT